MNFKIGELLKIKVKQKRDTRSNQAIKNVQVIECHSNFVTFMIKGNYYDYIESFLYSDFITGWVKVLD